jgi:hypothetical protein
MLARVDVSRRRLRIQDASDEKKQNCQGYKKLSVHDSLLRGWD